MQSEIGPADPAALAQMQVKNLDKFAKKLKKQYADAISQNSDAVNEIKFIDGKLDYLKDKVRLGMRRKAAVIIIIIIIVTSTCPCPPLFFFFFF